jgi:hypothetical protein
MPVIFSQTVTRLRAPQLIDAGGVTRPQRDWPNAADVQISGVSVQPVMTTEARDAAGVLDSDQYRLYTRRGVTVDVQVGDRVVWQGLTLDVEGVPEAWPAVIAGGLHHQEILLRRIPLTRQGSTTVTGVLHDNLLAAQEQQSWSP